MNLKERLNHNFRIILPVIFFFSFGAAVKAQKSESTKLPENPTGQFVTAYIKAFNSGNEQVMREFLANNLANSALEQRPLDERIKSYLQLHTNMEALELQKVSEVSASLIRIIVHTKKDEWYELGFEFEPSSKKLLRIRVETAEDPKTAITPNFKIPEKLTEADLIVAVDKYLNQLVAADEFSGAIIIANNERPIFQKAAGLASKEFNVPNRLDTKFNLGSINKIFTQIAIGQLAEAGKLSFDDKLGKHLPDYPNREAAEKVTIRHLLTMSSGIGDFFGPKFDALPKDRIRNLKDYMPLFDSEPLAFEPGTNRLYSNGGFTILGVIIEKLSGQNYYDYVRDHIFKPAGMLNTAHFEADLPITNMANGYTREGTEERGITTRINNIYTRPGRGGSAGGGYSTVEDLFRFVIALRNGKLRRPQLTPTNTGNQNTVPTGFTNVSVAGGAPGINAFIESNSGSSYTIIVMSNYDPPSAERITEQVRKWLTRMTQ